MNYRILYKVIIVMLIFSIFNSCNSVSNNKDLNDNTKYDVLVLLYPEPIQKVVNKEIRENKRYAEFKLQLNIKNSDDLYWVECHPLEREPDIGFVADGSFDLHSDGVASVGAYFEEPCVVTKWIIRIRENSPSPGSYILYTRIIDYKVEWVQ
jgi:hypothetical protein